MKIYIQIVATVFIFTLLILTGCEYDLAEPQWERDHVNPPVPVITEIIPAKQAGAGVNIIEIKGENFSSSPDRNKVYFDEVNAEIVASSVNSIMVRRPNLVSDSTTIKLSSYDALVVAKHSPYKIDAVFSLYGGFNDGIRISTIVVNKNEDVFVANNTNFEIHKILTTGEKTLIGKASKPVTDAKLVSDDNLILFQKNKKIKQMKLSTGEETDWVSVKNTVAFGDFDSFGNCYCGGNKSDLIIIKPNLTSTLPEQYKNYNILYIQVFNGFVYLLAENTAAGTNDQKIGFWKNEILDASGKLGASIPVFDWSLVPDNTNTKPKTFAFSSDGIIYVGTDNASIPIIMVNPANLQQDILYKGILSGRTDVLVWGNGNFCYQAKVDPADTKKSNLVKIDMGKTGGHK